MTLSPAQTAVLHRADRNAIKSCLSRSERYWTDSQWLADRNRYRLDCIDQIKNDARNNNWVPTHVHLSEYIAASAIIHAFDGWSFLGRAIDAELSGDPDVSRHLGYYAELRAAMALLAADGIGVFKTTHVVVDVRGRCHKIKGPQTHSFTWDALQYWASSSAGVNALLNAIHPGGVSLGEWLHHYPASLNFVATSWLKQWGLDLSRFADDQTARNFASYRPTAFSSPGPTEVEDTVNAVQTFWQMCEPGALGGFPVLDMHLLRRGVELAFKTSHDRSRKQAPRRYENDIRAMLHGVSPNDLSASQWERFLTYADGGSNPRILTEASGRSKPMDLNHSKEVLARAALLLRVATGSVAELLGEVSTEGRLKLEFWWSDSAVRKRLWPSVSPPDSFADLWMDVRHADEVVANWLEGDQPKCHHSLWNNHGKDVGVLATTERVALWGMGL